MNLTLFGASGRTGIELVRQALARGHRVTAFARSPQKLASFDGRIEIVSADVLDAQAVARAVAGADAVLSVLGPTANRPDYKVARGLEHIIKAMQEQGVGRLVMSSGAAVGDANDAPGLFDRLITLLLKLISRHVYEDMRRAVSLVRASEIDWTIVRVPMLADGPVTGALRVGYVGKGTGPRLARGDLARFMLDAAEQALYVRQAPAISN